MKLPTRANRKNREVAKAKKIVEKPAMRRIGFDLPDKLIHEFKAATSMNKTNMTKQITLWMKEYCAKVKVKQ